jgi:hypothetical protein
LPWIVFVGYRHHGLRLPRGKAATGRARLARD